MPELHLLGLRPTALRESNLARGGVKKGRGSLICQRTGLPIAHSCMNGAGVPKEAISAKRVVRASAPARDRDFDNLTSSLARAPSSHDLPSRTLDQDDRELRKTRARVSLPKEGMSASSEHGKSCSIRCAGLFASVFVVAVGPG